MYQSGCHFSHALFLNLVDSNSATGKWLLTMSHFPNIQALPCFSHREALGKSPKHFQRSNLCRFQSRQLPSQKLEKGSPRSGSANAIAVFEHPPELTFVTSKQSSRRRAFP